MTSSAWGHTKGSLGTNVTLQRGRGRVPELFQAPSSARARWGVVTEQGCLLWTACTFVLGGWAPFLLPALRGRGPWSLASLRMFPGRKKPRGRQPGLGDFPSSETTSSYSKPTDRQIGDRDKTASKTSSPFGEQPHLIQA